MNTTENLDPTRSPTKEEVAEARNPNTTFKRLLQLGKVCPHLVIENPTFGLHSLAEPEKTSLFTDSAVNHLERRVYAGFPFEKGLGVANPPTFFNAYLEGIQRECESILALPGVEEIRESQTYQCLKNILREVKNTRRPNPLAKATKVVYKEVFGKKLPPKVVIELSCEGSFDASKLAVFDFNPEVQGFWDKVSLYGKIRGRTKTKATRLRVGSPAWYNYLRWEITQRVDSYGSLRRQKRCETEPSDYLHVLAFRHLFPPMYNKLVEWCLQTYMSPYVDYRNYEDDDG